MAKTEHSMVYLVKHRKLAVFRIAKFVQKELADCERILREANLIKNHKHIGIPVIYDIDEDDNSICIIEEYIAGKSLADYVRENDLSVQQILSIAVKICELVEYLHDCIGIIHMDIKPANIIIQDDRQSDDNFVSIIDFDSSVQSTFSGKCNGKSEADDNAKPQSKRDLYSQEYSQTIYGTPIFCAPEQYILQEAQQRSLNYSTDIYSIGMLLLYMINGGHMQSLIADMDSLCEQYSKSIGPIIKRCIRHNQNQRFQSVKILKEELIRLYGKQKILKNNNTKKVQNIYVCGTKRGIGVTHFCLCMVHFLKRRKKTAVYIRCGDRNDVSASMIRDKLLADGSYEYKGIHILPDYDGTIVCDNSSYEYRIYDCGTQCNIQCNVKDYLRYTLQCSVQKMRKTYGGEKSCDYDNEADNFFVMIGDLGYRREDYQLIAAADKNVAVFINHISGRDFYNYVKHTKSRASFYRMPCMYDIEERNYLFEEAVGEFLGIFKEEKGAKRIKKFVKKHLEDWRNRNSKRNRNNAHGLNACKLLCQWFKS